MNLIKRIRSNEFAVVVAILSVLVQSFHSYTAFYNVSSLQGTAWGIAQAVLFAIVFDLAILFYTVRNKKDVVLGAAVFLVMINAYYYYQHLGFTFEFIFGCFLSVIIPVTQYYYSEEIREEGDDVEGLARHNLELMEQVAELEIVKKDRDGLAAKAEEIRADRDHLRTFLQKAETANKEYYNVVGQRDSLLNSNSVLSEALGRRVAEIVDLKQRLGESADIEHYAAAQEAEIREAVQDKSLLNVSDDHKYKPYNPTRSNAPTPESE